MSRSSTPIWRLAAAATFAALICTATPAAAYARSPIPHFGMGGGFPMGLHMRSHRGFAGLGRMPRGFPMGGFPMAGLPMGMPMAGQGFPNFAGLMRSFSPFLLMTGIQY